MSLVKFNKQDLVLTPQETIAVFKFYWPNIKFNGQVNDRDRSFAQALMLEAVEKSVAMGWLKTLFDTFISPSSKIKSIARKFSVSIGKKYYVNANADDMLNFKIYKTVRDKLSINFKSEFKIRLHSGSYIGY